VATIQYTTYRFNKPALITKGDYEILKDILTENPDYNINPPSSFVETFKRELIFLGIGALGFLIASIDLAEWLNWVGGIPAIFAFFSLLSIGPSIFSYIGFLSDKSRYYNRLKKDIVNSHNYAEFLILRNNRRWNLY
jgi:hypothetical protein